MTADHEVTPSDEIDQVWHLHLAHTRHYWGPWTAALGRPLHHNPTAGGPAEARRYRDAYVATLESYFQAFGEEPPDDLWPDPGLRFALPPRMRRVDAGRYAFVRWRRIWQVVSTAVLLSVLLGLAGPAAGALGRAFAEGPVGWALDAAPVLGLAIAFFGLASLLMTAIGGFAGLVRRLVRRAGPRKRRRRNGTWSFAADIGGDGDSGCSGCGGD